MSEVQIMNAMNQSVINKITEFKNKEIKKEELNHITEILYLIPKNQNQNQL